MQPDLLVLVNRDGSLAGFIEVKVPAVNNTHRELLFPLDRKSEVGGQLFDYLTLLWNTGLDQPVGMVHTFNECMVVWSQNGLPELGASAFDRTDDCSATFSSTESSHHSSACEISDDRWDNELKHRKLYASQVFAGGKDVVHATTAAIRYMLASNSKRKPCGAPQHGTIVGGRVMPKVSEEGINYVEGPLVAIEYHKKVSSKNALYLVQRIGRGSNAVCFTVVDDEGCGGVLKFYIDRGQHDYESDTEDRANMEVERWNTLNGLGTRTFKVQMGEDPAYGLLMPYCRPLLRNERQERLKEVERALRKLAEAGYHYGSNDVRWRHITVLVSEDTNGQLVLLDMNGVKELKTKDTKSIQTSLRDQLKVLADRMKDV